jgi:hypothetical protein
MSLLFLEFGDDTSVLEKYSESSIYIFVDSGFRNTFKSLKSAMKKSGFYKLKRFVFKKVDKRTGVVMFHNKTYKKYAYYFYGVDFANLSSQLCDFLKKCNAVCYKGEYETKYDQIVDCMNSPATFLSDLHPTESAIKVDDSFFEKQSGFMMY